MTSTFKIGFNGRGAQQYLFGIRLRWKSAIDEQFRLGKKRAGVFDYFDRSVG